MSAEFDRYRESYRDEVQDAIGFIGQDLDFFTHAKARYLVELATRCLGDPKQLSILDVGCGGGLTDAFLAPHFRSLVGVDISQGMVDAALAANPVGGYQVYDGETLPYEDGRFDMAFSSCVLHHVDPGSWRRFVGEMGRVVRPGGLAAVVEHNPVNPLTRLAVSRCEFDEDATLLGPVTVSKLLLASGLVLAERRYILFFPWRSSLLRRLETKLGRVPLGSQYIVAGVRPRGG